MPSLKQIEAFVWAVRLDSFADAARRLNVTQSTLSKRIAEFESGLGGALFVRSGHRAKPTPLGETILDPSERMLELHDALCRKADTDRIPTGRVVFGVTELVARLWLPGWVAWMRQAYPCIELEPIVDVSAPLMAGLRSGRIALAVMPALPVGDHLEAIHLADVEFALMASPVLDLPSNPDREALAQLPILAQSGGSGLTERFDAWTMTHGLTIRQSLASNSLVAISELVLAGLGCAFLPVAPYADHLSDGRLVRIEGPLPWPTLPYYLVRQRLSPSRAASALHDAIDRHTRNARCRP